MIKAVTSVLLAGTVACASLQAQAQQPPRQTRATDASNGPLTLAEWKTGVRVEFLTARCGED